MNRAEYLQELSHMLPLNPVGVEIGVLHGDFSKMILDVLRPQHLCLIDPYMEGGDRYDDGLRTAYSTEGDYNNLLKRFKHYKRVDIIRKFSHEVVDYCDDCTLDLIYHDASHLYHDVKRDLNDWLPKLKPGGLMCGHDYTLNPMFGVMRAVNEFCEEHGFEMILLSNETDYALKRKQ